MTVPYSSQVATSSFSCFLKLLFRWKGSIYKLLWKEFAVFASLFYSLSFLYRFILSGESKTFFEKMAIYCNEFSNLIPLAFVLGFYVSIVVNRFWEQYRTIPYPTRMAMFVSALLTGFMLPNEQEILEKMSTTSNKYFVPLVWSASLVLRARKEGRIKDDFSVKTLIDEINDYRGKCGTLFGFDHVTVPIVYTQVVTIAVYMFFMSCLMGRQFLENGRVGDMYFPFFTFLQFFFYMGWLKVAESLVNPFGEDDDDFDINGMIDKNLPMSYLIVDEMHNDHPELIKDQYWDSFNITLPYTEASQKFQKEEHVGSAANIDIPQSKAQFIPPSSSMSTLHEDQVISAFSSRQSSINEHKSPKNKRKKVLRNASKLSNFFRSSSRQTSRLDPTKEDEEANLDIPLNPMNEKTNANNDNTINDDRPAAGDDVVKSAPSDDLMFQMSDDEGPPSPKTDSTDTTTAAATKKRFKITKPLSIKDPSRTNQKSDLTTPTKSPDDKPAASSLNSTSGSVSAAGGHSKLAPPHGVLEAVLEASESPEAFVGSVISQLKEIRMGTSVNK
ncbi:hypothetical protein HELRODRAFT_192276 [Helobdella robusta]|uniref:Bestrophin homolog n=1 Tax=Helobdella robusta TaxID=6412 RepID=T1FTS4_HELRO|nr:hypothetical protein HELRODRAFT_192276 [Helobdella robusta]ESO01265.1 hypothetical protein HELRODRAFT_192276 [Helobdella robusta]